MGQWSVYGTVKCIWDSEIYVEQSHIKSEKRHATHTHFMCGSTHFDVGRDPLIRVT